MPDEPVESPAQVTSPSEVSQVPTPEQPLPLNQAPAVTPHPIDNTPPPQPSKKRGHKKRVALILVLLLVFAGAAGYMWWSKHNKTTTTTAHAVVVVAKPTQYCYVRWSFLDCVDNKATNLTRYDLPLVEGKQIDQLIPSPDQSQYVARMVTTNTYWLLDSSLKNPKQIINHTGDTVYQPAWSHDGKSLFMELDPATTGNTLSRHIYRYDVKTAAFTQLTTSNSNRNPDQLADGKIIYLSFSGSGDWTPYIMNADGSSPKPYAASLVTKNLMSTSYDRASDTVYFMSSSVTADVKMGKITYFPASDPTKSKFVNAEVGSSEDFAGSFNSTSLIFSNDIPADVIDLATGKPTATIAKFGAPVGLISTTPFTKSAVQTEDPHERIVGLKQAPADFQAFIAKHFDSLPSCDGVSGEYSIGIEGVVRDTYARTGEGGCGGGAVLYYVKQNGTWALMTGTQMGVSCSMANQYKFTKELLPDCFDASNNTVKNTNP